MRASSYTCRDFNRCEGSICIDLYGLFLFCYCHFVINCFLLNFLQLKVFYDFLKYGDARNKSYLQNHGLLSLRTVQLLSVLKGLRRQFILDKFQKLKILGGKSKWKSNFLVCNLLKAFRWCLMIHAVGILSRPDYFDFP